MDLTRDAAESLDDVDPLAGFRSRFVGTEDGGPDRLLYLDGNSLGRLPRDTPAAVARVVEQEWGRGLVGSWTGWMGQAGRVGDALATGVLGARPGEVLVGDSTSVDLYKLLVAGCDARPGRDVLVCCADDFPTDRYVVAGVAGARGMTVREVDADFDKGLDPAVLAAALDERVAVVVLSSSFAGDYSADYSAHGSDSEAAQRLLDDRFPARAGQSIDVVVRTDGPVTAPETRAAAHRSGGAAT